MPWVGFRRPHGAERGAWKDGTTLDVSDQVSAGWIRVLALGAGDGAEEPRGGARTTLALPRRLARVRGELQGRVELLPKPSGR